MSDTDRSVDYKATVFLPKTDFPMRAGLPKREPDILARWQRLDMYARLRAASAGREKFVLADGPPYANGNIHIGHAQNKILKDVVTRTQQMLGKDSNYVPGWDCHGLPIEWKIEEKYRKAGKNKDEVPVTEFRRECRDFAAHWIDVQADEFRRLGIFGDWDRPYKTMDYRSEALIVKELGKFLMNGGLYRGLKAVMWSPVEQTALAEAEVEYHDHTSTQIHVAFPMVSGPAEFEGAHVVIWTTTPWTIPGNRAIAYGPDFEYAMIRVDAVGEGATAPVGAKLIVAEALLSDVTTAANIAGYTVLWTGKGSAFAGAVCHHPLRAQGYDTFEVPLLPGEHVTTEQGTGLVHTAPAHGAEDFELGLAHGLEVTETVQADGTFSAWVPLFAGVHVYKAAEPVCAALAEAGALLARSQLVHSYPHSWRSKKPLIFRATSQWFISMQTNALREKALSAIDDTRFVPPQGRNRLRSMIENRPDWCVSRQRAWGVPITVFVDKATGAPLRDQKVLDRVIAAVEAHGVDAWFTTPAEDFLAPDYDPAGFEKVDDILDVWFDSGSTHAFVLEERGDLKWPADIYLEGSDQHRGWFQSSLLVGCGTRGRAPYDQVLTHGFSLDKNGHKMSKSLGNVIAPQKIIDKYGADILRLWVVSADYTDDVRIGDEIVAAQADVYRRLRNTLRFLLGALDGFEETEKVPVAEMPELERWVLHRLTELDAQIRQAVHDYDFNGMYQALHTFCGNDLSAFYLDIRKDALYCDTPDDPVRRAARTVMDIAFDALVRWLAPFLVFTAEEAWLARRGLPADAATEDSVHLVDFADIPDAWADPGLADTWQVIRRVRRVATGALELARKEKQIGASLQAHIAIYLEGETVTEVLAAKLAADHLDFAELAITSAATVHLDTSPAEAFRLDDVPGVAVTVHLAEGRKCARCWKVLPEVAEDGGICGRCRDAVAQLGTAA